MHPNDPKQQVSFLTELSNSFLKEHINDNVVLGGDFNCVLNSFDKKGGKPFDRKKASVIELQTLIKTNNLIDSWCSKCPNLYGFTWSDASKKIRSRLDYLFVSKSLCKLIQECTILPNTHSDHSAVLLNITGCGHTTELNRDLAPKSRLTSKHDLAYNRDLKYFWSHYKVKSRFIIG